MQHRLDITRVFAVLALVPATLVPYGCALVEPALDVSADASVQGDDSTSADSVGSNSVGSDVRSTNSSVDVAMGTETSASPPSAATDVASNVTEGDTSTNMVDSQSTRRDASSDTTGPYVDVETSNTFTHGSDSDSSDDGDGGVDATTLPCVKLTSPASDLSELTFEGTTEGRSEWSFVSPQGFTGTLYVEGYGLTSEMLSEPTAALHVAGTVSGFAQVGLHFYPCVDASSLAGVVLDLAGTVSSDNKLRAEVQMKSTTVRGNVPAATCVPSTSEWWYECAPPDQMVTIPSPHALLNLPWSTFEGGIPTEEPDPTEITGIELEFPWGDDSVEYQTDLIVNSISFLAE